MIIQSNGNSSLTRYISPSMSGSGSGSYTGSNNPFTITMNEAITETVTWQTQYQIFFTAIPIESDANSVNVLTVNSVSYSLSQLPQSAWYDSGTQVSYSFFSSVVGTTYTYAWSSTSGLGQGSRTGTFQVSSGGTVTATYSGGPGVIIESGTVFDLSGTSTVTVLDTIGVDSPVDLDATGIYLDMTSMYRYLPSNQLRLQVTGGQAEISVTVPVKPSFVLNALNYAWATNILTITSQSSTQTITVDFNTLGTNGENVFYSTQPLTSVSDASNSAGEDLNIVTTGTATIRATVAASPNVIFLNGISSNSWSMLDSTTLQLIGQGTWKVEWSATVSVSITVDTGPSGLTGSIVVDGTTYASPQTFNWVSGDTHTINAVSTISGGSGTEYVWMSWSDGLDQSHAITVPSTATTYTANYQTQYQVTYTQTTCSLTVSLPLSEWVNAGGSATGTFPSPVNSIDTQCIFQSDNRPSTITGPTTVTGTYKTQYYLTVSSSHGSPTGEGWYDSGASASFSVTTPVSGGTGIQYVFTGWSSSDAGGYIGTNIPSSVTMSNPITETASWKTQWQVSLVVNPTAAGSMAPSATAWYEDGAVVNIQANANSGYAFFSWSSSSLSIAFASPSSTSTTATIGDTGTITAGFTLSAYTIDASSGPGGSIAPSGSVSVNYGADQSFTITADANYHILDVLVDGGSQGAVSSYTFHSVTAIHTIAASFAINAPTVTVVGAYHGARVSWTTQVSGLGPDIANF